MIGSTLLWGSAAAGAAIAGSGVAVLVRGQRSADMFWQLLYAANTIPLGIAIAGACAAGAMGAMSVRSFMHWLAYAALVASGAVLAGVRTGHARLAVTAGGVALLFAVTAVINA